MSPAPAPFATAMSSAAPSLPLERGAAGPGVAELQRRLRAAGYPTGDDPAAELLAGTEAALQRFQHDHGMPSHGVCDRETWARVVEAEFQLGDRLLCLVSPMTRGKDVAELQLRLGSLGFDAGRVDGIFGPSTQLAVRDFQRNAGLVADDVCGPDTVEALQRLEGRAGRSTVAGVRERERLRQLKDGLIGLRLAVGGTPDTQHLADALVAKVESVGGSAAVLRGTWEEQADAANQFGADAVLGLTLVATTTVRAAYFEVPGFASYGGQLLAERLVDELPGLPGWPDGSATGMQVPLLRETRAPAVLLEMGPVDLVSAAPEQLVTALYRSVDSWIAALD